MCLITLGLCIKSGLFPFHFWMPDTYGYATPASGGILSGLVSKGYIFFLLRVIFRVFGTEVFYQSGVSNVLFVLGAIGVIVGSVSAAREMDVARMIAYSSASQIGYIFMGFGLSPSLGVLASVFHILTHAITKPPLFLSTAQIARMTGGRDRRLWLGAGHQNRLAGLTFTACALSMIGIPLTMGFVSKYRFGLAAFDNPKLIVPTLIVLAISTILNTWYFMRVVIRLYTPASEPNGPRVKLCEQRTFAVAAIAFLMMNLGFGVAAKPVVTLIEHGLTLLKEAL
jgi:multicomponent Na+:H+ antiporter subunit D